MFNRKVVYKKSAVACAVALALYAGQSLAQQPADKVEVVIVTGSYIVGTAKDAALPVSVFTAEDLQKQGSPSMVDMVKSIPSVMGVMGDSNQFVAGQSTGSGNVNLRGLQPIRTLVLLNGKRMPANPAINAGVDTNLIPAAAIGRIEVLKDGAAATYGSDAIAGVVNFITLKNFEGVKVDGSYSYINGSDGDYNANIVYGWKGDTNDLLITAGYRHRSELQAKERDWAVLPFDKNPQGGWTGFGSPGTYLTGATFATRVVDPACAALGGTPIGATGAPVAQASAVSCSFQYTAFDNLVEREEHYQTYLEFNQQLGDKMEFHFDGFYAAHNVPQENSSPSYGPNQGATGGAPNYFIPRTNPGLAALIPTLPTALQTSINAGGGLLASGLLWRPLGAGGNPITGEGKQDQRKFDEYRLSAGLKGDFGGSDIHWDTSVTYGQTRAVISTKDEIVSRLGAALSGLGGPNCTGTTAGANGCLWFNPFSTGVDRNVQTGAANPAPASGGTFTASTVNSVDVVNWIFGEYAYELKNKLFQVDGVLNGTLGWKLPGGDIGWAAGAQYRRDSSLRDPNDLTDIAVNPCPTFGSTACTAKTGVFSFFGPLSDYDLTQDVYAAFGELSLPITDSLQAQVAVRHEDYGGKVGATTNPKLQLRWQLFDALALRGSVGTTFRAPPQVQLVPSTTTTLAFTTAATGYKPYDNIGNPNLEPETATTFNVGMLIKAGGFNASIDYWNYDFKKPIINEGGTLIVAAFYANPNACTDPAYAGLKARMTFVAAGCGPAATNLSRTEVHTINGPKIKISGIDTSMTLDFPQLLGGDFTLGLDGTYTLKYEVGARVVEGITVAAAGDFVGKMDPGNNGSLPQWKASLFAQYATSVHNLRWTIRHIDGMDDLRAVPATTTPAPAYSAIVIGGGANGIGGAHIASFTTHDLNYQARLPSDTTLELSVFNVFDRDPPFARLDLSYDPFTANPLGRYYKVGMTKKF